MSVVYWHSVLVLFEGFNDSVSVTESSLGQFDPTRMALDAFRFVMRSQRTNDQANMAATATTDGGIYTLTADVSSGDLPSQLGLYDWIFYAVAPGTGSDTEGTFPIVTGTLDLKRGMKTCP
jgi:hypothetical protein